MCCFTVSNIWRLKIHILNSLHSANLKGQLVASRMKKDGKRNPFIWMECKCNKMILAKFLCTTVATKK